MSCYHVGLDVHKESTCIAVLYVAGKPVMESAVETGAAPHDEPDQGALPQPPHHVKVLV